MTIQFPPDPDDRASDDRAPDDRDPGERGEGAGPTSGGLPADPGHDRADRGADGPSASDAVWAEFDATDQEPPAEPSPPVDPTPPVIDPSPIAVDPVPPLPDEPIPGADPDDIAAATADLDDETDQLSGPRTGLSLAGVEEVLNRRWPETKIEPTLTRIAALVDVLGHPEAAYPVIQVAGTNGKTSTARMIDALLSRIGMRTGRFTSPHLQSVTERISIDGVPVSPELYVHTYAEIAPFVELIDAAQTTAGGVALTKFEILTAMAFAAFADAPVDVGVIEVGLGGRWDSTNVASAQVGVITPVGLDHMDYLGDTLAEIAAEKAGIIKPGATVVIGAQPAEAMQAILRTAVERDATVARYGSEFSVLSRGVAVGGQRLTLQGLSGVYDDILLPLHGPHQAENAAVALAAVEAFFGAGRGRQLDVAAVQDAFAAVASPGRLERVGTNPTVLIDAAHNPAGAAALAAALADEFAFSHLVGVVAVLGDKDVRGILGALADSLDEIVVTRNSSPRALPAEDLAVIAAEIFDRERVHVAGDLRAALATARELTRAHTSRGDDDTGPGAGVLVTGSVVSAGDARALAGRDPQ